MPSSIKLLMASSLVLLAACATQTDQQNQSDCGPDFVRILNEETGRYDCVSQLEMEQIIDELDERRW